MSWSDFGMIFVCVRVEVLWPSQPIRDKSNVVSLPHHTFTGQALSSKWLTNIEHILSSETDNCPSWQLKGENDCRNMINFHERMLPTQRGSNLQPPDHQSDKHPTEQPRPADLRMCRLADLGLKGNKHAFRRVNSIKLVFVYWYFWKGSTLSEGANSFLTE